jgi:hypothetical protein
MSRIQQYFAEKCLKPNTKKIYTGSPTLYQKGISLADFCAARESGAVLNIILKRIFSESFFEYSDFFFDSEQ